MNSGQAISNAYRYELTVRTLQLCATVALVVIGAVRLARNI